MNQNNNAQQGKEEEQYNLSDHRENSLNSNYTSPMEGGQKTSDFQDTLNRQSNSSPNYGYENQMNSYPYAYYPKKNKLQLLHYNPEISDFDHLSMSPKKLLSWTFFSLFMLAVVVLGVGNLISLIVELTRPEWANSNWFNWAVTFISLVLIGLPVFYLFINKIPDSPKGEIKPLKITTFIVIFFICASAMYITNMFSLFIVFMLSIIKGENIINPLADAMINGNYLITLVYAAIIAPIVEEVIFRGLLLSKLRRFGDIPAILLSGLAFGCFHFNLSQFFYAAVLGFIFAYVTIRTNTIKYSIILHVMINSISTAITPLTTDGNIIVSMILSAWVFASIIIGAVFFAISFKKIRLEKGVNLLKGSSYFFNLGVILYTAISIAMIIISIVI